MRSFLIKAFPKKNLDALFASAFGFFIIYLYTKHSGIGVSPDSVVYLSVARNIHAHWEMNTYTGKPIIDFPAFYPIFLSAWMFISGLDLLPIAPVLNGCLFASLIYLCGWMMESFESRSKGYKLIFLIFLAFSPGLLEVYSMLWSETLFLLLTLLFMVSIRNYLQTYQPRALLISAAITAFACDTRYAGVTIIATGCLLILIDPARSLLKKIRPILVYSFISGSLLMLNLIRNAQIGGTLTGMREKSQTGLKDNLIYFGNTICDWFPLPKQQASLSFWVAILLLVVLGMMLIQKIRKKTLTPSFENITLLFSLIYGSFIILSATLSRYELINSRLLSPFFIPMLWSCSSWVIPYLKRKSRVVITLALIFAVCFLVNQYKIDTENYEGIRDAGVPGYTEDPWMKDSEIVRFLRQHPEVFKAEYPIYSNADDALYFFTGRSCQLIPHSVFPDQVRTYYTTKPDFLVYFNDNDNAELITLEEILAHKNMKLLYKFSNGSIYSTVP